MALLWVASLNLEAGDGKKPQAVGVAEERIMEKLRNRMGKVFVSNGELEELDSMSDESEELPMKSSYKFARGNVVKAKPKTQNPWWCLVRTGMCMT